MAVDMLLKSIRFSQKASLRRKEVRQRAWARSALKLAKVAGFSRALGLFQSFAFALPTPLRGAGRKRWTAQHFGPTVRGCNAARRERRPLDDPAEVHAEAWLSHIVHTALSMPARDGPAKRITAGPGFSAPSVQ